jgi:hypothetical protein
VPLVGDLHFTGQLPRTGGFSLSATRTNVTVISGVLTLPQVGLTLTQNSLTLSATVPNLPVVGSVTFAGAINFSGSFTISATAPHFTLLSFIGIDNATVAFSYPNPRLTVSAHVSLAGMANADFTGTLTAGGHFSFDGHADLIVAGFTLGRANLHLGNNPGDPSDGIHIGPFTTPPLPVVAAVTLKGSYGPRQGQFSFSVDLNPTPPIMLGPIPLNRVHLGLSADGLGPGSLTLGAGIGYNLNLQPVITAAVDFDGKLLKSGSSYTIDVHGRANLTIAGFTMANATLDLDNAHMAVTVHYAYPALFTADFAGSVTSHGAFDLTARAAIHPAGFNLAIATLHLTNSQLDVTVDARVPLVASAHFHGNIQAHSFLIEADATVAPAGFHLANAHLVFSTTQLDVSANFSLLGVSAGFHGYIRSTGAWGLDAYANIRPAGYDLGNAFLVFTASQINIFASLNLPNIAGVNLGGYINSGGGWWFGFYGQFNVLGFGINGGVNFNSSGVTVAASVDVAVLGTHANVRGSISANGQFSLTASAGVNLGVLGVGIDFALNNGGFSAHLHAFAGYITHIGWWIFSGDVGAGVSVDVGFSIRSDGYFTASGSFNAQLSLLLTINVGIGFDLDNHHLTLHLSDIGFDIWGIGFHPFGDVTFNF